LTKKRTRFRLVLSASLLFAGWVTNVSAEQIVLRGAGLFDTGVTPAEVRVDLSSLPRPEAWRPGDPIKEIPQRKGVPADYVPPVTALQPSGGDPLRALGNRTPTRSGGRAFDTPLISQDGVGFTGVNPPDTVGDVGNDYYVQLINGSATRVLILDKTSGVEEANFTLESLATFSGGGCASGKGDPIVMFDAAVDNGVGEPPGRWFLSEFTDRSFCVYISQTADPTAGLWYIYEFFSDSGALPDYPKYGVWPDAYYIGANEDGATHPGPGRTVYALDRESMLQGLTTRPTQVFEVPGLAGFGFQMLQPADWDGVLPPPPGTPGLFLRHRDDEVHNAVSADPSLDFVELWSFSVDWDNPGNSTFSGPTNIGVADFESDLCGLFSFSCVPQPGSTTRLDPLREPVMWRAQYRNFGTHQVIVGSWVTDVAGGANDLHGVRWAELRDAGTGWTMHQQGTISPDDVHRWMPSIAMDGSGNIAVGYNVSDATAVFPGLRYTGRLLSDPLDTMPVAEVSLAVGAAPNPSNRYGDYSSMNVDPVDECTFWFTGEYNPASQWNTRIGKFRFETCGEPNFILSVDPAELQACVLGGDDVLPDITLEIGSLQGFGGDVSLAFDPALSIDFTGSITPDTVMPADPPAAAIAGITALSTTSAGVYPVSIKGTATGAGSQTVALSVAVADIVPSASTLQSPLDAAVGIPFQPVFEWDASDQANSYLFELATDSGFSDILVSETVDETAFQLPFELDSLTDYFWRVSPLNQCGAGSTTAASFTTALAPGACGVGTVAIEYFADDMESGENGWTHAAPVGPDTWNLQDVDANSPESAWQAASVAQPSDQRLVSPGIVLPDGVSSPTLQFFSDFSIEESQSGCYDGAIVEYSDDDGQTWIRFESSDILDNPYVATIEFGGDNVLEGLPGWCGIQPWTRTVVDLDGLGGRNLRFRFRLGTDVLVAQEDWLVDDVLVQSCEIDVIFSNGFEQ